MKGKSNEWVSIADLMSGVMAVVMLLLVISVLQKTWSEIKHQQEAALYDQTSLNKLEGRIDTIKSSLQASWWEKKNQQNFVNGIGIDREKLERRLNDIMQSLAQVSLDNQLKQKRSSLLFIEREKISKMLNDIQSNLDGTENESLVMLDINSQKITLKDGIFNRGSACITPQARQAFSMIENQIKVFLSEFSTGQVFIEGHTDNIPVLRPVTNFEQFCTVYDDNFTLSAARAREARKFMINDLDEALSKRVTVAGYGDSQPLTNIDLDDARQRRIEVRFVVQD